MNICSIRNVARLSYSSKLCLNGIVFTVFFFRDHCRLRTFLLFVFYLNFASRFSLKEIIYPNRDKESRIDTSLDVWLFEAKGLPSKKRYDLTLTMHCVLPYTHVFFKKPSSRPSTKSFLICCYILILKVFLKVS